MSSLCRRSAMFVFSFAAVLAFCGAPNASAQKLSYEQAMAKCQQDVRAHLGASEGGATAGRYARAGACMMQYGYRLKKSDRQNF